MARPVVKWAEQIQCADDIPALVRRAQISSMDAPRGPVCLAIPSDVMDEDCTSDIKPTAHPRSSAAPDEAVARDAAAILAGAKKPVILCGDGVAEAAAQQELVEVAAMAGALIYSVLPSEVSIARDDPAFVGNVNVVNPDAAAATFEDADVIVAVGAPLFPLLRAGTRPIIPSGSRLIQIDADGAQLGRSYTPEIALKCDPRAGLRTLRAHLEREMSEEQMIKAANRREQAAERKRNEQASWWQRQQRQWSGPTVSPFRLVADLVDSMPAGTLVFDDSVTTSRLVQRMVPFSEPSSLLVARGGGLGQGLPGTYGLKLARPERPVLGVVGDGSAMYTIQALWTAARHGIQAVVVICNNRSYRILAENLGDYLGIPAVEASLPCFDLSNPPLDFASIAESYGVRGLRVERPDELTETLSRLADKGPGAC